MHVCMFFGIQSCSGKQAVLLYNHWNCLYFWCMEIRNLHQPFVLNILETNEYEAREHKNTFFEMVFVLDGKARRLSTIINCPTATINCL